MTASHAGSQVPAVGISVDVERVFTVLQSRGAVRSTQTQVLVGSSGRGLEGNRMTLAAELWREKIFAEFVYDGTLTPEQQTACANQNGIPFVVLCNQDEITKGLVKLRDVAKGTDLVLPLAQLSRTLRECLQTN